MILLLLISFLLGCFNVPIVYDHKINQVQEVPVKQVASRGNLYMMSSSEMCSYESLQSVLYWCNNVNTYYQGFAQCDNTNRYYNLLQDSPLTPSSDNIDNVFLISQIGNSGAPSTIFNARRLRFYSTIVNGQYWRRWYYYIEFGNDGNNDLYAIEYNVFTDIVNTTYTATDSPSTFYTCTFKSFLNSTWVALEETDYAFSFYLNSTCYSIFEKSIRKSIDDNVLFNNGVISGYGSGYETGKAEGYTIGYNEATAGSPEITSIFTGILDVGLLPVNVFLTLFNFELFGVNVSGLMTGLLTVGMIFILLRFIFGGKTDDK